MEKTYDVFISYSRKDYLDAKKQVIPGNVVSQIKELLTKEGISFWFDEEGIYSGQSFTTKIVSSIEASRIFLFLSTENSNKSRWTCKEIATADELGMHIIPVRIDETPYSRQVLFRIADLDYVEYYANPEEAKQDIVHAIKTYLQEQSQLAAGAQEPTPVVAQSAKPIHRPTAPIEKSDDQKRKMLRILLPSLAGLLVVMLAAWWFWPKGQPVTESEGKRGQEVINTDTLQQEQPEVKELPIPVPSQPKQPAKPKAQADTARVKQVLEQYARSIVEKDFDALDTLYAPQLERFQDATNLSREKVIEKHESYEQAFSAVIRSADYRWETLKVIPLANGRTDVECVQDFRIQRTANSRKPNYYVLEQHFVLDRDYRIVSVFDIHQSQKFVRN
ncbi:MAG: TIR domain-containing protein [Paludibacteraceae bacterium]|nr:TIR domain-containing protein [Paludibacteraceae bacterium]